MGELSNKIEVLEKEIKKKLESTRFMTNIEFRKTNNYFAMEYEVFNHQGIRQIIDDCCKETLEKIRDNNDEIISVEYEGTPGQVQVRKLLLDPRHKHNKTQINHKILCDLKEEINNYFLRHEDEMAKYAKLIEKRCHLASL